MILDKTHAFHIVVALGTKRRLSEAQKDRLIAAYKVLGII